jgi:hypothetical protein
MDVNVIVSQIIRSPGVYFEKKKSKYEINLNENYQQILIRRSFIPSGEAFISEFDLFFPLPTPTYDPKKEEKIIPIGK